MLPGSELDADLVRHCAGYLALQSQNVLQFAFVAARPKLSVGGRFNQLGSDANMVPGTLHGTLNDGIDIEFPGNFRKRFVSVLVNHGSGSRYNPQGADLP